MQSVREAIRKRHSTRTFDKTRKVEKEIIEEINAYIGNLTTGPFGSDIHLELIDLGDAGDAELKKYIAYGNVKGSRLILSGHIQRGVEGAFEDFGYCMEAAVLKATQLGLDSVWLAGGLKRGGVKDALKLPDNRIIPGIVPIGYAASKPRLMDKIIVGVAKSSARKSFDEMFYRDTNNAPLEKERCKMYTEALEAVRLAPSASNKQPWRIVRGDSCDRYHFFLDEDKTYNTAIKDIKIQNMDMGIALLHFEDVSKELHLPGGWEKLEIHPSHEIWNYCITWIPLDLGIETEDLQNKQV